MNAFNFWWHAVLGSATLAILVREAQRPMPDFWTGVAFTAMVMCYFFVAIRELEK